MYIILIVLIFFGLPEEILYSQGPTKWIPFILIFFVQTYLLNLILSSFNVSPTYKTLLTALSVLIIGPSFGIYIKNKEKTALQKYGQQTKGVVYKKWYNEGKNSNSGWLLRCNYKVGDETYSTFSVTDKNNVYKIGDTLTIIYNSNFPQQCEIRELD